MRWYGVDGYRNFAGRATPYRIGRLPRRSVALAVARDDACLWGQVSSTTLGVLLQKAGNAMIETTANPSIRKDHSAVPHSESGRSGVSTDHPALVADKSAQALTDPVCGMTVTVDSPHVLQHEGKPIHFCSAGCKTKFVANPAKYQVARPESKAPTPPA